RGGEPRAGRRARSRAPRPRCSRSRPAARVPGICPRLLRGLLRGPRRPEARAGPHPGPRASRVTAGTVKVVTAGRFYYPTPVVAGALSRFRMLDLSRQLPGPFCSMLLADLGMDVLTVVAPTDPMGMGIPLLGRNKRSLTLNLKAAEGREIFHRLAREADVVLE